MVFVINAFLLMLPLFLCCSININGNTVACSAGCEAIVDSGASEINGWLGASSDQYGDVSVLFLVSIMLNAV